jgi:hypothetical protein
VRGWALTGTHQTDDIGDPGIRKVGFAVERDTRGERRPAVSCGPRASPVVRLPSGSEEAMGGSRRPGPLLSPHSDRRARHGGNLGNRNSTMIRNEPTARHPRWVTGTERTAVQATRSAGLNLQTRQECKP